MNAAALALPLLLAVTPPPTAPDPFLRDYAETRRFLAGRPAQARLTPDGAAALFLRSGPRSNVQALHETDLRTGATRLLVDAEKLLAGAAQALTAEERAALERQRITARGLTRYELSRDGRRVVVGLSGQLYLVERATGAVTPLRTGPAPLDARLSPDGTRLAYVRAGDLHVLDLASNAERRLTEGGGDELTHGLAEFVAQEEMGRFAGFWWSPDGRSLAFEEADLRRVEKLAIADPVHPERPAERFAYPRAGRENAAVRLGVVPVEGGPVRWVGWDAARFPYLCTVAWSQGAPLTILVMSRAQTEARLLAWNPATGAARALLEERDAAWLNLVPGFPRWLDDGSGFLWATERSGATEVELRGPDGAPRGVWVRGEGGFGALAGVDAAHRRLWFTGGPDPTRSELYVAGEGMRARPVPLVGVDDAGWSTATVSRDGSAVLVTRSTVAALPRTTAYDAATGARRGELPSVAEEPPRGLPAAEVVRVGEGEGMWARVQLPPGARPGAKLPVIVDVYGGPHAQQVTRSPRLVQGWLAGQGFAVVAIDGRGTPRRGRAFERALKGDLGGANLDDQVAGLRALAARVPELDLRRVGIAGWSFGGYLAALAVMKRPEVFHAAMAGAPVADWRDYDTFYTERYLGHPDADGAAYDRSSLLAWAPALDRPLLVMHGTADDNVYFLHALKLSDALFRAGRPHELLPLSGFTHLVADPLLVRREWEWIVRFFRAHLG